MTAVPSFTHIADLSAEVDIPADGTLSRVIYKDDDIRLVLFAFDAGQELTEHSAAMPAIIQVIDGRIELGHGAGSTTVVPGTWVHMGTGLTHSVVASEPTILLLTLLRQRR